MAKKVTSEPDKRKTRWTTTEPAPERKRTTTWATFLKSHWDVLGAIDFTTIEVWTKGGLVTL